MFEFSQLSTFQINATLRVKPINMICNKTILENVFLQDLNQYINDYIITRGWYLIDGNIAQRGNNGPNHVIPGWLINMCARPGSSLGKYMCVCLDFARSSFHSEIFSFYFFNNIYYFRHLLLILSQYLYQSSFYRYLPFRVFELKMWEDVRMYVFFSPVNLFTQQTKYMYTIQM